MLKFLVILIFSVNAIALDGDISGDGRVDFVDYALIAKTGSFDRIAWVIDNWLEGCEYMPNRYAKFDGVDGLITVADSAGLRTAANVGAGDFSIGFWAKDIFNVAGTVLTKRAGGGQVGYDITTGLGSIALQAYNGSEDNASYITVPNFTSGWKHIVFIRQGTVVTAYLNGNFVEVTGSLFSDNLDTTSNFIIGYMEEYLQGSLDDLRIYKSALTAEQVAAVYAQNGVYASIDGLTDPTFVMNFDTDFVSNEIKTEIPASPSQLVGTRTGGVTIKPYAVEAGTVYPNTLSNVEQGEF